MKRFNWYSTLASKMNFNTINKAINYLTYIATKKHAIMPVSGPTYVIVQLITTNRCNLKCAYCVCSKFVDYNKDNATHEMNLEFIKKASKNPLFNKALLIDFSGGEPLLVNDLEKSIAFLKKQGHLINMSTNGLLLKDRICSLKEAGISRINVSLYPENIQFLKKVLPDINNIFSVSASYVLTKSQIEKNLDEIFEIISFIKDAGCMGLRFYNYQPLGRNADRNEIITNDIAAYHDFRLMVEKQYGDFISWDTIITISSTVERKKGCRQLWGRVQILPDGTIKLCCGSDVCLPSNINILNSTADNIFITQILSICVLNFSTKIQ
jgi:MoaA/NifB/PqqE/SkfB family radical SAM enzyme